MSKIKPPNPPRATRANIQSILNKNQLLFSNGTEDVTVVCIRGYYLRSMGDSTRNDRGIYDDAAFIVSPNHFSSYNANTDPSRRRKGMASLTAPQVIHYRPGYHGYNSKYGHPAFRQASDVTVFRDDTQSYRDGTSHSKFGKCQGEGVWSDHGRAKFWTNLHRGGRTTTSSAGCLTIPPSQWNAFRETMELLLQRCMPDLPRKERVFPLLLVEDPRVV